jgi:lipopolysaccharide/colanic/teichoic acid biosynthesis glycosyltransferase
MDQIDSPPTKVIFQQSDQIDHDLYHLDFFESESSQWWYHTNQENALLKGRSYLAVKRIFDISSIILLSPILFFVMVICALLIKIESPDGPIIFTQQRTGKLGQRFLMYKFRTMVPNAEEIKKQLKAQNELAWPDFKIKKDPRVTRIGRILRRTSLDELPQIINILKGEMSIVGPRPTSFGAETYEQWQMARLEVTPGLTGLWQIIGRAKMEFDDRARLDIAYIKRQCFALDFRILIRTIKAVFQQNGAV